MRFTPTATVLLAAALAGCNSDESARQDAPQDAKRPVKQARQASAADVKVTESRVLPDKNGSTVALARVQNTSDKVAIEVGGRLMVRDGQGKRLKTVELTPINILPGGYGVFEEESLDVPRSAHRGSVGIDLTVARFIAAPKQVPVSFGEFFYAKDPFVGCRVRGTATITRRLDTLEVRAAGFTGGRLATAGFGYLSQAGRMGKLPFEADLAACPPGLDRVEVYPALREDQITGKPPGG